MAITRQQYDGSRSAYSNPNTRPAISRNAYDTGYNNPQDGRMGRESGSAHYGGPPRPAPGPNAGMPNSWGSGSGGGVAGRPPLSMPASWGRQPGPKGDLVSRPELVAGPSGPGLPQSRPTGPTTAWYGGPPTREPAPVALSGYRPNGVAGPRSRPHIDSDFPSGRGTGGAVPEGWSNARERRYLEERGNPQGRPSVGAMDPGGRVTGNGQRRNARDGRMPGRHNGRAINGVPRPRPRPAPPRYDNRYGRPGTNNPPYPHLDDPDMRHIEAQRGQLGRQRAFEARHDSGLYTPEQAAHGVDRQYGYQPRRPNDPGYAEYAYAQRYGGPSGGGGGNVTGTYGSVRGRPDNYGRSSVSGGGSFGTSPSPNR
jgi:hypothetical protein